MDDITQQLKAYIEAHPFDPGTSECQTVLEQLYQAYFESHESDPPEIKEVFTQLGNFLETAAEVIVAAVYGAGSAFAGHEVMPVCRFNFNTADIAANCVFDNHCLSSLKSSLIRCAPVWRPSM